MNGNKMEELLKDERYKAIINKLKGYHSELLKINLEENPVLIGRYLGDIRLTANLLFTFLNHYITIVDKYNQEYNKKRQDIYQESLNKGLSSSAATGSSRELTRFDEARVESIKYTIQVIKNDYERYNSICIYLQSRLREFNTERMQG